MMPRTPPTDPDLYDKDYRRNCDKANLLLVNPLRAVSKQLVKILDRFRGPQGQAVGLDLSGVQVKHDRHSATSERLWIEVEWKLNVRVSHRMPGGIFSHYHEDCWIYAIGHEQCVWFFDKKLLQYFFENRGRLKLKTDLNASETSMCYFLPIEMAKRSRNRPQANRNCLVRVQLNSAGDIAHVMYGPVPTIREFVPPEQLSLI